MSGFYYRVQDTDGDHHADGGSPHAALQNCGFIAAAPGALKAALETQEGLCGLAFLSGLLLGARQTSKRLCLSLASPAL